MTAQQETGLRAEGGWACAVNKERALAHFQHHSHRQGDPERENVNTLFGNNSAEMQAPLCSLLVLPIAKPSVLRDKLSSASGQPWAPDQGGGSSQAVCPEGGASGHL